MGVESVFRYFKEVSGIPRVSYEEERIADYLVRQGERMGLAVFRDGKNNVILKKAGTGAGAGAVPVVLQAHSDMVWVSDGPEGCDGSERCDGVDRCDEADRSDGSMRMGKIPHRIHVEDGMMRADKTTLGADDGIGIALILALLEEDKEYPPLEAVFTANEEETMEGAMALTADMLSGRYLINLDSEAEGVCTIGAAGGISARITLPVERREIPGSARGQAVKVELSGGLGGHSGLEIGERREHAIKLLVRLLRSLDPQSFELQSLEGGTRSNAIPDRAAAVLHVGDRRNVEEAVNHFLETREAEWRDKEPRLKIEVAEAEYRPAVYGEECREQLFLLLEHLPHGVADRTEEFVISSVNLALVWEEEDCCKVELSLRSSFESWYGDEVRRIGRLAKLAGAQAEIRDEYPAWTYESGAALTRVCSEAYRELFGSSMVLENVHAGVECGIIMKNCPSIREAVSLGPTILNAHTTKEALEVQSVEKVYHLLDEVLTRIRMMDTEPVNAEIKLVNTKPECVSGKK